MFNSVFLEKNTFLRFLAMMAFAVLTVGLGLGSASAADVSFDDPTDPAILLGAAPLGSSECDTDAAPILIPKSLNPFPIDGLIRGLACRLS